MKRLLIDAAKAVIFTGTAITALAWYCILCPPARAAEACAPVEIAPSWAIPVGLILIFCGLMQIAHGQFRDHLHFRKNDRDRAERRANVEMGDRYGH